MFHLVYMSFSRKRWTNAGRYAPAKPRTGLEKEYRLWGRVRKKKKKTTQCTTRHHRTCLEDSCLRKCVGVGVHVRVRVLERSQQNGSRKEPVITIEGWKLNPYTTWHGQQSQQQSNPGRGSPTCKAHALLRLHLPCPSPPPLRWPAGLTGLINNQHTSPSQRSS